MCSLFKVSEREREREREKKYLILVYHKIFFIKWKQEKIKRKKWLKTTIIAIWLNDVSVILLLLNVVMAQKVFLTLAYAMKNFINRLKMTSIFTL